VLRFAHVPIAATYTQTPGKIKRSPSHQRGRHIRADSSGSNLVLPVDEEERAAEAIRPASFVATCDHYKDKKCELA